MRHDYDDPLPDDEYDITYEGIEFSVYSPRGHGEFMTWGILYRVGEGLKRYLVDKFNPRECFFRVLDGPTDYFVGYGHLVSKWDGVQDE